MADSLDLAPLVSADLALLEEWFKDRETADSLAGMLPLEEWFQNVRGMGGMEELMAYEEGTPVGFISLEVYSDQSAALAVLVAPGLRRKGYGKRLVEAAVAHARAKAVKLVNAYTHNDNKASIVLMERSGFNHTAGPDEDGFLTYSLEL